MATVTRWQTLDYRFAYQGYQCLSGRYRRQIERRPDREIGRHVVPAFINIKGRVIISTDTIAMLCLRLLNLLLKFIHILN